MPSTLAASRYGLETAGTYNMGTPTEKNWHYLDPLTPGLSADRNIIERPARWGIRGQRKPVAGPPEQGGTLGLEFGPENITTLLYAAFGDLTTDVTHLADGYWTHQFTPGNTQRSIYYEEYLQENDAWFLYPGTTVDSVTFTGDIGAVVRADFELHSADHGVTATGLETVPAVGHWSFLDPFTGIQGGIDTTLGAWDKSDNWVVTIDFGTNHKRVWGAMDWYGAAVGTVRVTVSCNAHFTDTVDLEYFLGYAAGDPTTTAIMWAERLETLADFIITAQTDEDADNAATDPPTAPYLMTIDMPEMAWVTHGPYIEEEDYIRQPLTGTAWYDPHDLHSIRVDVRNKQTNAQVVAALAV